eukprot:12925181-Prorocentrum_lima.AAC.1
MPRSASSKTLAFIFSGKDLSNMKEKRLSKSLTSEGRSSMLLILFMGVFSLPGISGYCNIKHL